MPQQTLTGQDHPQMCETPVPEGDKLACLNPESSVSAMWATSILKAATGLAELISEAVNSVAHPTPMTTGSKGPHQWYVPR